MNIPASALMSGHYLIWQGQAREVVHAFPAVFNGDKYPTHSRVYLDAQPEPLHFKWDETVQVQATHF
jgi:hypothetical protein